MSLARSVTTAKSGNRLLPEVPKAQRRSGLSAAEAFRIALQGLGANKLRAFLTMLGIIIGVASVIVMVALGQGVAQATQQSIQKLGTNVLTVMPNRQMRGGVSQGLGSAQSLKLEDLEAVLRESPSVRSISAEYGSSGQVKYENQNTRTNIQGALPEYFGIRNLPISRGRAFTKDEVRRKARVAVLGDSVRETLFGGISPLGKFVKVNGQSFQVVGVVARRGAGGFRSPDDQITIPVTTAMRRVFGVDYLSSMTIQAVTAGQMGDAQEEVMRALAKVHRQPAGAEPDVRVFNQADLMESANQQSSFLTMLLAGIALVSLVVGGIGIMNIMLVSVTERTREIGIRKAIGAKRRDILYQFLIESVTLSLVGGLVGIGAGIGISLWLALPPDAGGVGFPMLLNPGPMILSFGFSAVVGVFFGIYPAMKASALNPIQALRHE
ncbi:MAG: ABC-type antimicrobial peptide transport system,permease component [Armatimonadetes bacterium]|jgi:ABC-type antimicrobial peptide transport system permease subunit|nr:ABC-type antimicrobial peptide transport system,permease component [Armatimonadota bacterium]